MILRSYFGTHFPTIDTTKWSTDFIASKPVGLWVSDDEDTENSWPAWCRKENYRLDNLRHVYRVELRPEAKILHLSSPEEVRDFSRRYGMPYEGFSAYSSSNPQINWREVGQKYEGIIITPYQWACRLDRETYWYYGWDCASGCIWEYGALKDFAYERENLVPLTMENVRP